MKKIILTIILFCIPLTTIANFETLDLIFTLQEMWIFTEDETFNLIMEELLWVE